MNTISMKTRRQAIARKPTVLPHSRLSSSRISDCAL